MNSLLELTYKPYSSSIVIFTVYRRLTEDTVICYLFGVEIFSDGALRPKFCYANIFPT